jgi:hypothetical protein
VLRRFHRHRRVLQAIDPQPVDDQGYLGEALKDIPPNDLVLLDTGDGAAICVSDPEEALFACLAMQSSFARDYSIPNFKLEVRIGINLGSVKLIKDLNGNLNAVGDGINVAQRVMSFAGPNQILAARSFFEVASSLSDEYQRLFSYEGIRTDKHVKEHSVYALATPEQAARPVAPVEEIAVVKAPSSWSPELLAKVESKLALALGPIAKVLVRNTARAQTQWDGFTKALVEQLPTDTEKDEFRAYCESLDPGKSRG